MDIVRLEQEIDETINLAYEALDNGSKFPGMSYEEGIINATKWLSEEGEPNPMDD